jgi:Flp pilus assembly protein TadB
VTAAAAQLLAVLAGVLFAMAVWARLAGGAAMRLASIASRAEVSSTEPERPIRLLERLGRGVSARRLAEGRSDSVRDRSGWTISRDAFAGLRAVCGAAGIALGVLLPMPGRLLTPLWALAGARVPVFLAGRAAKRRRGAIDAEVPQLLDLLAAASSAGLSAPVALRRAAEADTGPLAGEIGDVLRAVDLGSRWRDELRATADRLDLPDVRRTVSAITRTETLGASLADSTGELAASVRHARRAAVTERARTAPVKMLFPLVFLVLPAFLLLTVVPVLLTTLQSIH